MGEVLPPGRADARLGVAAGGWPLDAELGHPLLERRRLETEHLGCAARATDTPPGIGDRPQDLVAFNLPQRA